MPSQGNLIWYDLQADPRSTQPQMKRMKAAKPPGWWILWAALGGVAFGGSILYWLLV